jgi:hypothetical protein
MNVTAGNVVVCVGTYAADQNPTSFSNTGTGTVSWTVVSGMKGYQATQAIWGGWGNVTGSGSITPSANFATTEYAEIVCAEFSGVQAVIDGTGSGNANAGTGTGTNAQLSGTFTTGTNGDLLVGGFMDMTGGQPTVTAGTLSETYAKVAACTGVTNCDMCMEYAVQATAASTTAADWTINNNDFTLCNVLAIKASSGNTIPSIVTNATTDIAKTTTTGNGNVTSDGGASITERGGCWATSVDPVTGGTCVTAAGTTGAYTYSITSLSESTAYYTRAYATNSVGTSYGENWRFTTMGTPKISTNTGSGTIKTGTGTGTVKIK